MECYAPEKVILYSCGEAFGYGSLARGEGRWDFDADIMVVMSFEGGHLTKIREMVRRPEEVAVRYRSGDPLMREALDHGEVLHG